MPHASQFSQVFTWKKLWKIARTMSHARVLAIFGKLSEGNLRVLGCIGSLSKTHTGVTAHLWTASGCPAP